LKKLRACEEGWGEVGSSDANKKRSPYPFRAYPPINPPSPFINAASLKTIYFADEDAPQGKIWRNKKTEERTIKASSPG
jgi:hypothetical protein